MSLARAFTKRTKRSDETPLPRSCTVKYTPGTIIRAQISLPTKLISTTNVHALNAPDIPRKVSNDSSSSIASSDIGDGDFSTIDKSFLSSTDASSLSDLSPITPFTPLSDDSKDFFSVKNQSSTPTPAAPAPAPASDLVAATTAALSAPSLPQRCPSHSKKAHMHLARQRSIQRFSPPPTAIADKEPHPFGAELAKVNEIAEGFGGPNAMVLDEEEQEMMSKGLKKFSVNDYVNEVATMYGGVFEDQISLNPWI